ncbi:16164_t:CDS:2 [Funneliformis caledonium]|uniref:16164_t:CDS:1 n=1 Tax=Funneliformis caledonium TaxID=1117310 RepID=A0A9N9GB11_9GLOM|nr:16164_t:CDS:2 [Funneliformis caledonium]
MGGGNIPEDFLGGLDAAHPKLNRKAAKTSKENAKSANIYFFDTLPKKWLIYSIA